MNHPKTFLDHAARLLSSIDPHQIDTMVEMLVSIRGCSNRVFCIGNGGGAAIASHAVNDLRKICGIEAYAPHDNYPEISARINDDGYGHSIIDSLKVSRLNLGDVLLVFSVGGGSDTTSANLAEAIFYARKQAAFVLAITGADGGECEKDKRPADVILRLPTSETPYVEGLQGLLLHAIVSNPLLCRHD